MTNFICRDAVQVAMDMSRSLCLIQDNLNFAISEAVEGLFKAGEIFFIDLVIPTMELLNRLSTFLKTLDLDNQAGNNCRVICFRVTDQ